MERNRLIILGMIVFFMVMMFPYGVIFNKTNEEETSTQAYLKELESQEISEIHKEIRGIEKSFALSQVETPIDTLRIQFQESIIIGDSIAEGLIDYRILPEGIIYASRGLRSDNCTEFIDLAISRAPSSIFLAIGMNDLEYCRGDSERFINEYTQQVDKLIQALPHTKIYINGILPMNQSAIDKVHYYQTYPQFNEQLEQLCIEKNLTYIDNSFILNTMDVPYVFDGIHPEASYYQEWANNMSYIAKL